MRWPVFALATYLLLGLQVGLAAHIQLPGPGSLGPIEPRFLLLLAVFVALSAPTTTTLIACGIIGFLLDITSNHSMLVVHDGVTAGTQQIVLIGPYTLGYMAGGYFVVQMRPMLFRQHPLTIATMMFVAGAGVHLVVLFIYAIRGMYEPMVDFRPVAELMARALSLLYSAVIGLILAYPLTKLTPFFGLNPAKAGRH